MHVARIHIPLRAVSFEGAIIEVQLKISPASVFEARLKDISMLTVAPFSLELYARNNSVTLAIASDEATLKALSSTIHGYLGDAEIHHIPDYTETTERTLVAGTDLHTALPDIYPLQSWRTFNWDSMTPLLTALGRIPTSDSALVQVLVRPLKDTTALQASKALARFLDSFFRLFRLRMLLKHTGRQETDKLMQQKASLPWFSINYRISSRVELPENVSNGEMRAAKARLRENVRSLVNAAKIFNTTHQNRFIEGPVAFGPRFAKKVAERRFDRPFRVSAEELTTFWHVPFPQTLPNTFKVLSRKSQPPRVLPTTPNDPQISFFGRTNYREQREDFGIRRFDRRRHLYVLGKSGNGKSCLLQLLIKSDIEQGHGCAVLDPHGDLVDDILRYVPRSRAKDVVIFDPSDINHPPSFNPMIPTRPDQGMRVTLSFLDIFKKVFHDAWSDKMDGVLRYSMMALLNIPGSSIVSLRRLLSDDEYRSAVVKRSSDEVIHRFWEVEFPSRRDEFESGPIPLLLNKLDELLATDMIRNILGQSTNSYDFREFMDSRKIVLFKVSKGVLGAENASLLGSLVMWKLYEAAMSRADQSVDARQDFYCYVDEFQNFATSSFGEILSESRKYRLCLTFANQFLGQLPPGISSSVFGNVANFITFRVGAQDSGAVANELKPRVGPDDLLNLGLREFYVKMSVDGEGQDTFSGVTLDVKKPTAAESCVEECLAHSRAKYSIPLAQAEEQLALSEIMSPRAVGSR